MVLHDRTICKEEVPVPRRWGLVLYPISIEVNFDVCVQSSSVTVIMLIALNGAQNTIARVNLPCIQRK